MQRIQFRRGVKGWRMPPGAITVSRRKGKYYAPVGTPNYWGNPYTENIYGRERSIALFRRAMEDLPEAEREAWLAPLRTATALMCFCSLDAACHADVLLEYLNRPAPAVEGLR